jgi:hypothetical protein
MILLAMFMIKVSCKWGLQISKSIHFLDEID